MSRWLRSATTHISAGADVNRHRWWKAIGKRKIDVLGSAHNQHSLAPSSWLPAVYAGKSSQDVAKIQVCSVETFNQSQMAVKSLNSTEPFAAEAKPWLNNDEGIKRKPQIPLP
jgi:hypothetical protein